ncbi:permease [Bacillus alveayuensis]|uniref:permease n=1 Tax=Aeribacillus alveayuensis TaxID=279215 RepID=UPI0005D114B2|nr:permease [Bacillus alveayuensis]
MRKTIASVLNDFVAFILLLLFLYLFFFIEMNEINFTLPKEWAIVNTMFLSIILEAIPFILIGVFVSAFIQTFTSEDTLRLWLPKNPYVAIVFAAFFGIIFPVCECAIIPIVRRLIKKGMPPAVGMTFLMSAPILNPVVFASTYYAFQSKNEIAFARMGLAFLVAVLVGIIVYRIFKQKNPLKTKISSTHEHVHHTENKWKATLYHASDEFFDTGKYLLIGAFLASLVQTFLNRNELLQIGTDELVSPFIMMGFAYVLSLCSEADAFVASSFGNTFSEGAILAFLIYGPMLDLKNTLMLFAYFRTRFVIHFIFVLTCVVYFVILLYQTLF